MYSTGLVSSQKNTETKNRHEETRQNRSSTLGGLRACDTLLTYSIPHYSKMALVNKSEGLKEEYSMEQDLFS